MTERACKLMKYATTTNEVQYIQMSLEASVARFSDMSLEQKRRSKS